MGVAALINTHHNKNGLWSGCSGYKRGDEWEGRDNSEYVIL